MNNWHKQELFKGRGIGNGLGGTTWAGWNIDENILGVNKISVEEAIVMDRRDPAEFKRRFLIVSHGFFTHLTKT